MRWPALAYLVAVATLAAVAGREAPVQAAAQDPSPQEQLLIYAINRARHDPARYQAENNLSVDLSGIEPRPPLAVNNSLVGSASFHAEEMAAFDYFAHQSQVTGDFPNKMARDNGYNLPASYPNNANNIESLAAGFPDVLSALEALIVDAGVNPPGHRIHLLAMNSFFATHREIGTGFASNASSTFNRYYAIHTGVVNESDTFLTGVVFTDANDNRRYDLNEGLPGVTVSTGAFTTATNAAGGWSLKVPSGTYTVTAQGGGFAGLSSADVTVTSANVEVDFISGRAQGIIGFDDSVPPTFSLNGTVTTASGGLSGVTVTAGTRSATTSSSGSYTITGLTAGEHTVTPSRAGFTFDPPSRQVLVNGNQSGVDFTAAAAPVSFTLTLSASSVRSRGKVKATVTLDAPPPSKLAGTWSSSHPDVIRPPKPLKLTPRRTTRSVRIQAKKVTAPTDVTLSLAIGETVRQVVLTVTP